ncbi:hypothetical protein [Flavobacterium sp. '19STA2R22 D10 B1']|uniref:hypothetical protein n=1 Tax=Flavobacterium aerium TaxID=3037261 RepID=UPI00278C0626|nr:hypothetical protein [Flavobacterium sp. '19STA2R22 D10 B1']
MAHQAEIQSIHQIASHTWDLKIQCDDLNYINYIEGLTIEIFSGNQFGMVLPIFLGIPQYASKYIIILKEN